MPSDESSDCERVAGRREQEWERRVGVEVEAEDNLVPVRQLGWQST